MRKLILVLLFSAASFAQVISGAVVSGGMTAGVPNIQISSGNPPPGTIGVAYSFQFQFAGGTLPVVWSESGPLPTGLTLTAGGRLSGTPNTAGNYSFTVTVTDANTINAQHGYQIQIPNPAGPSLTPVTCPNGAIGSAYSCQFLATGGTLPYAWSILPGGLLPNGVTLNASTGLLSGTPFLIGGLGAGTFNFTIQVKDANNLVAQAGESIFIPAPPSPVITNADFPNGTVGTAYNFAQGATGGLLPYVWTTSSGSLPGGLTLNAATGAVTGTPNSPGTFTFTETVTDANTLTDFQQYTVVITGQISGGAQLPTSWADSQECNKAAGLPTHSVTLGTLTQAGLNAAIVSANTQRDADGSGTTIIIPHGTQMIGATKLTLLGSNTTTGNNSTKCIIIDSDTPVPVDTTQCSGDVKDASRNPGCTNTISSLWTFGQSLTSNNAVVTDSSGSVGPAHHYLIRNGELRFESTAGKTPLPVGIFYIGRNTETTVAQMPHNIHITQNYLHGYDSPDVSAYRGAFYACQNCSFNYNYMEMIHGVEGQGIATQESNTVKVDHNYIEGGGEGSIIGGGAPTVTGFYQPSDYEFRGNNWTRNYADFLVSKCGLPANWATKNRFEIKNATRVLIDGQLFSQSWCDGQTGFLVLFNVRACSVVGCNGGNNSIVSQITLTNSLLAHAGQGIQTDARSDGSGNGNGQALPGSNWWMYNLLVWDIGDPVRYPYGGSTAIGFQTGSSGNSLTCSASRDGAGAVATLTCAAGTNIPGTGMSTGDVVRVSACTGDQGFLTGLSLPYVTATAASPTSLTVIYPNIGAAGGTATNCTLDNSAGNPNFVTMSHVSVFGASNGPIQFITSGQSPNKRFQRNLSAMNNIFAGDGGNPGGFGGGGGLEGSLEEQLFDTGTLHFNSNVLTGRKSSVYTTYQPGEMALNFPGNGVGGLNNQTGIICSGATPTSACIGYMGGMNGVAYNSNPSDYHIFALRSDSVFAAAGASHASDGTDLGANIAAIDAAIESSQYTCATACGTGPFSDLSPFTFATGTGNNTSASSGVGVPTVGNYAAFTGLSTDGGNTQAQTQVIEPAPTSTSNVKIAKYMYPGFSGDVWCHVQPWWTHGSFGHPDIGQDEANTALIAYKVARMKAVGCTVIWVDYYASNVDTGFSEATAQRYMDAVNATTGMKIVMGYDSGSFKTPSPSNPSGCPLGATDLTACIVAKMKIDWDVMNTKYFTQSKYLKSNGKPVLPMFVSQANWSGTNWEGAGGVWDQMRTYSNSYNSGLGVLFVKRHDNIGFSSPWFDGAYAWPPPAPYDDASPQSQFCWQDHIGGACDWQTGKGGGVKYLTTFYTDAKAHPTKLAVGTIWPGFDWSQSGYLDIQKVMSRIYGQVLGFTGAQAAANGYNAASPLYAMGVATWDDYGEGTGVEPGVDNGWSVTLNSTAGGTAAWTLTKADVTYVSSSTIDHIEVIAKDPANNTYYVHSNLPATATSLTGMANQLPAGVSFTIYVRLVGRPLIQNKLSNGVAYSH